MDRMKALFLDFAADGRGATAIEYGLVAGLISMTIIIWAQQIGQSVLGFFESVQAGFN
jgi:Flp pilus assembly pilin Flp